MGGSHISHEAVEQRLDLAFLERTVSRPGS